MQELVKDKDEFLLNMAKKHIWWKTPEVALIHEQMLLAQIMERGELINMHYLTVFYDNKQLAEVLEKAEIGQFTIKSWHFWHYNVYGIDLKEIPPLPTRRIK